GVTPLMAAAGMGISQRDPAFSTKDDVQGRAIEVLDVLLKAGADIDARVADTTSRTARIARPSSMTERQGQTALFGAARFGWQRVVEFLLDRGADSTIADVHGATAGAVDSVNVRPTRTPASR